MSNLFLRSSGILRPLRLFTSTTSTTSSLTNTIRTMSTSTSQTPVEDVIREKLTALSPTTLLIRNDSHLHAHHAPMRGSTSAETHFHVTITSPAFRSKLQPARHRMVYALLKEEMSREDGIHALQLRTKTPEEEERQTGTQAQK